MNSLARESWLHARRLLMGWVRAPEILVQALIFPTFLLVVYKLVLSKSIDQLTGSDTLYGLVPMCAIVGVLFGALGTGAAIPLERESGLLSRLWTLPVHRASALAGRLLAEAVRALAGSIIITAVGVALGLRFTESWLAVIPFVFVPVLMVIGFATVVVTVAVLSNGKNIVMGLSTVCFVLLFFNTGMVPVDVFPGVLQHAVRLQPMSPAIDTMRGLAGGGPVLVPLLHTIAWVVALLAMFGPLAVRNYRVAAEAGS